MPCTCLDHDDDFRDEGALGPLLHSFVGLAVQGKDIVFRFIIEYNSSLRDFYRPLGNNNRSIFYMRIFER
jgi:hypothetical protein